MRPTRTPAFQLRVALRAPDGQIRERTRLCWADVPSSAAVLDALLRRVSEARCRGLRLVLEEAPTELGPLLVHAGFGAPDCPLGLGAAPLIPDDALSDAALSDAALLESALSGADDASVGEL